MCNYSICGYVIVSYVFFCDFFWFEKTKHKKQKYETYQAKQASMIREPSLSNKNTILKLFFLFDFFV